MAEGVATAWHAGELPHSARGQYSAMIQSASSSFAEGKLLLVMAILSAIVAYVTRGQVKNSLLVQQLGKSRLGPRFAEWVGANRDKLLAHPKLQPKPPAGAAERKPAGSQGGSKAPEAEKPASPDKPEKKGKAERPCPVAPGAPLVAAPVSPITGAKILAAELDLDFALPAPLPLIWQRVYSSDARRGTWLGQGWSLPISDWLRITADEVVLIDPFERDITFSLPRVGQSIHSPSEQITLLRSDEHSFEVIDPDGLRTLFATLGGGDVARLTGWIDANNNHIKIEYDARQLPVRIEDSAGRTYALEFGQYRGTPRLAGVSLVQPGAAPETLVRYEFDAAGNLQRVRNRAGDITRQFAYRNHMMVEHSQPDGLVSRYEYDVEEPEGKVTRTWTNTGQWWELRYLAQETIVTDNLGREQRYRFDARRRYVGLVDAAGGVTTRELDEDGHLLALTDPGGRSIRYHYDTRGRVIRVERGGRGTGIVYDSRFDKPALITDALGHTTALRYDGFGNLVSVTNALGQRTSYQYDGRGLPIKVTDARGGVKRLDYNNAGQLISYTDCSNNTSSFSYDAQGRLVRALDANGHASTYQYDALGRLTSATHADGSVERYEYDAL
ncbi:MAG: DUF6531 domain-containing protein, partial [Gammaproteobacteria bacterium]